MSMISDEFSYCHVTPADDSIVPAVVSMSAADNHQLYIKINTEIIHHPSQDEDDDGEDDEQELPDYMRMVSSTREFEMCIPVDQLYETGTHTSWSIIFQVGLPAHIESMLIDKICSCAQQMALENQDVGCKVLPILVSVSYVDEEYQVEEEYDTGDNFVTEGASESVIESLEKVMVETSSVKCVICLEGMEIGTEAKKIACEHRFHGDCIVDWLRVSNLCPLCRFRS